MVLPALIIAKLAIAVSAEKGFIEESKLQEYLKNNQNYPIQHLIDSTNNLLSLLHTILILIQVSNNEFGNIEFQDPNDSTNTITLNKVQVVAAFPQEYLDVGNNKGILSKSKDLIANLNTAETVETTETVLTVRYPQYLQKCFTQLADLPGNFQIQDCLKKCLKSADKVKHAEALQEAISLMHFAISSADLDQTRAWLNAGPTDPITQTQKWLISSLKLGDDLDTKIDNVNDPNGKKILRQVEVMLNWSGRFYLESLERIDNGNVGNDIKTAVSQFPATFSSTEKNQWVNLQNALFGAIGWHIFNQARYAASQINLFI